MTISDCAPVYELRCPHQHRVKIGDDYATEVFCKECGEWIETAEVATVYVEMGDDEEVTGWVD